MHYQKPHRLLYRIAQVAAWLVATFVFGRRYIRNEIRHKDGPFVVIANHQAALDFVNIIGATRRPMSFVISQSFFSTLPVKGFMEKLGVIPKQQFQTATGDLKKMRAVIQAGQPLVIYPAGLMCEDGLSTPIPSATYKFLKWLGADVYMAATTGSYFVMPKWGKGLRPGRTYIDIYKLLDKEELATLDEEAIRQKAEEALLFDAYRQQEVNPTPNRRNRNVEGLENVLYLCPHCGGEYTIQSQKDTLYCSACGYTQVSDEQGILHNHHGVGEEIRYVSDWSRLIHKRLKERIRQGQDTDLSTPVTIRMVDTQKKKFVDVGQGILHLNRDRFRIAGQIHGQDTDLTVSLTGIPTLPFSPGKHLEIQQGSTIYRCVPQDGRLVMKLIQMVKIFYELSQETISVH